MNPKDTVIGIELGSTRIKAVLLDRSHNPIASGSFEWENQLVDGIWTYSLDDVKIGVKTCFSDLRRDYREKFGEPLNETGAIGISGMMHGYVAMDKDWNLLVPFRTWRNTITGEAAEKLTSLFSFNVPQRWSISHLYQAILNKERHLPQLVHVMTIAGYVHHLLTGENVIGVGEASGMFPIDSSTNDYDEKMVQSFDALIPSELGFTLRSVFPRVATAGEDVGCLTEEGALFLDETGSFKAGIPFAPAEGDAGTGMVATNSVANKTGNVSAGTSVFAMVVTDKKLGVHREIDMVTTPTGLPVAMVHCNNCTSEINAWTKIFAEVLEGMTGTVDKNALYTYLFKKALEGTPDCDGLLSFNYYSGEGVTDFDEGRPVLVRKPDADFSLASFMRMNLMSALVTLKMGLDILASEKVEIERLLGHGGYFKTPEVGQRILSAAVGSPVSVMSTAGEGGPYGMALLAAYRIWGKKGQPLEKYLEEEVFASAPSSTLSATKEEVEAFDRYADAFRGAMPLERKAIEVF